RAPACASPTASPSRRFRLRRHRPTPTSGWRAAELARIGDERAGKSVLNVVPNVPDTANPPDFGLASPFGTGTEPAAVVAHKRRPGGGYQRSRWIPNYGGALSAIGRRSRT